MTEERQQGAKGGDEGDKSPGSAEQEMTTSEFNEDGSGTPAPYKPKYKPLWSNTITIGGMYLAIISLILLLTFGLFSVVSPAANPYVNILGFLMAPSVLVLGVLLMPFGILFRSWRLHRRDPDQRLTIRFPRIDLNDPRQRRVAKFIVGGAFFLLPVLGVASYHGYHFTDSTEFCAEACHAVMSPEATAFRTSSHARVACAECHIGSGASWFVKSKLSGTRQVLAVLTNSYSRPIPPAIKHLRPARDTCEQCHWPNKFHGAQLRQIPHFQSDENNTRRDVTMLVKTGGADETTGRAEGIHLHMLQQGKIEYVATDDELQAMPWVRWVDPLGEELIYRSDGLSAEDPAPDGVLRTMDCMDCHNRPAHKFRSPDQAVNAVLDTGRIDTTLPFVKREVVAALSRKYPDAETARLQIVNRVLNFYHTQYPHRFETDRASVRQAAEMAARIYRENIFPYMRVDWRTYPDNIGHFESPGCFRCHDGKHVNQYGNLISHECKTCHTFLNRVKGENGDTLLSEGDFVHPYELKGMHNSLRCDKCHTGGPALQPDCAGCHTDQKGLFAAELPELSRYDMEPSPMNGSVECLECHNLDEPLSIESVSAMCVDCHDEDYADTLTGWVKSLDVARGDAQKAVRDVHDYLASRNTGNAASTRSWVLAVRSEFDAIDKSNALHNPDGVLAVYRTITDKAREVLASLRTRNADTSGADADTAHDTPDTAHDTTTDGEN